MAPPRLAKVYVVVVVNRCSELGTLGDDVRRCWRWLGVATDNEDEVNNNGMTLDGVYRDATTIYSRPDATTHLLNHRNSPLHKRTFCQVDKYTTRYTRITNCSK